MVIAKEEQYKNELMVYGSRHEDGVRAVHAWLLHRRDVINQVWPTLAGEELNRMQGMALQVARLISLIEQGPKIKQTERGE